MYMGDLHLSCVVPNKKQKAEASAVNPAGWEGLVGISIRKPIRGMTESEIQ